LTELYLIRHGQSENNAHEVERGGNVRGPRHVSDDPALTPTGEAQAACVAEYLRHKTDKTDLRDGTDVGAGHGIQRLYCSGMLRALQTTQPIADSLGLEPQVWLDVHEEGGIWFDHEDGRGRVGHAGLRRHEVEARFAGFLLPDAITEEGWWNRPFETREQLVARSVRVAAVVRKRIAGLGQRVAIVSHGTFLSLLVQQLLFGEYVPEIRFSMHNTGISRLDFEDGSVMLRYSNRIDHLPRELIT